MGRRGDQHRVNVVAHQHVAEVSVGFTGLVAALVVGLGVVIADALAGALAALTPHIADGQHLHIFSASVTAGYVGPRSAEQMAASLRADPDKAHRDALAGRKGPVSTEGRSRDDGRRGERCAEGASGPAQESAARPERRAGSGERRLAGRACRSVRAALPYSLFPLHSPSQLPSGR